jgi:hypothetical protein
VVDGDTQAIDELAAEPGGPEREQDADEAEDERQEIRRVLVVAQAEQPAADEQEHDHEIPEAVPHPDRLGPRAGGDRQPVDQPEEGRGKAADDADRDRPERDVRELLVARREVDDVEQDATREQAERQDDEHRVDRVAQQFHAAFHGELQRGPEQGGGQVPPSRS